MAARLDALARLRTGVRRCLGVGAAFRAGLFAALAFGFRPPEPVAPRPLVRVARMLTRNRR